eukprot:TRINITY_DN13607_c0_g1_i1.p1 TRINITY_DN13607_c0_g1~~TRINITY_DN13607_c0_g1_i1.p1  ORF type:complete len:152 (+),score=25.26 TRINITY_DN13607_c0_g1_i1:92-547(+)
MPWTGPSGVKLRYGCRAMHLLGTMPETALDCAVAAASLFGLRCRFPQQSLWLRLRGEPLNGAEAAVALDSDDALCRYLDVAGRRRLYAVIDVSVTTLAFAALESASSAEPAVEENPAEGLRILLAGVSHIIPGTASIPPGVGEEVVPTDGG